MGMSTDSFWMQQAYNLALQAQALEEVPVGAVVVSKNNELLGQGYNQSIKTHDPSAHAEILAIREAATKINNYRLVDATLYVTLEPCVMCAGTMVLARIKRLVFATRDFKAGAAGSVYNLVRGYPLNHQIIIDEGIMQKDCACLLSSFWGR